MKYKICKNGIFKSIQGEGAFAGYSAVFIRLAECNMNPRCEFCDEKFDEFILISTSEIIEEIENLKPFYTVVITGGEPTIQKLDELYLALKNKDYFICLETNGTKKTNCSLVDWIVCSPKNDNITIQRVDEFKFVVNDSEKVIEKFINKITSRKKSKHISLQPKSNEKEMINTCLSIINKNPRYRLSMQLQKIINVR